MSLCNENTNNNQTILATLRKQFCYGLENKNKPNLVSFLIFEYFGYSWISCIVKIREIEKYRIDDNKEVMKHLTSNVKNMILLFITCLQISSPATGDETDLSSILWI